MALKHAGVSAIIAKSFARIFYRNAINVGLPVITADVEAVKGEMMSVDLENGIIENISTTKKFKIKPFNQFMLDILKNGGLVKHHLKKKNKIGDFNIKSS